MSQILKQLIKDNMALPMPSSGEVAASDTNAVAAARQALIESISEAVSVAVAQYLRTSVSVLPGQLVTTTGSPTAQAGLTTTPGTLLAR